LLKPIPVARFDRSRRFEVGFWPEHGAQGLFVGNTFARSAIGWRPRFFISVSAAGFERRGSSFGTTGEPKARRCDDIDGSDAGANAFSGSVLRNGQTEDGAMPVAAATAIESIAARDEICAA
jgi:hypothetical protein